MGPWGEATAPKEVLATLLGYGCKDINCGRVRILRTNIDVQLDAFFCVTRQRKGMESWLDEIQQGGRKAATRVRTRISFPHRPTLLPTALRRCRERFFRRNCFFSLVAPHRPTLLTTDHKGSCQWREAGAGERDVPLCARPPGWQPFELRAHLFSFCHIHSVCA